MTCHATWNCITGRDLSFQRHFAMLFAIVGWDYGFGKHRLVKMLIYGTCDHNLANALGNANLEQHVDVVGE